MEAKTLTDTDIEKFGQQVAKHVTPCTKKNFKEEKGAKSRRRDSLKVPK